MPSRGKVDDTFSGRIEALQTEAKAMSDAARGNGPRQWQTPEEISDLLDIPSLHDPAWDREGLNANYEEMLDDAENSGTAGDIIGVRLQLAYNAAEERAFRTRHATPIRLLAHATARRKGHGNTKGTFAAVRKLVEDAIAAGAT